VLRVDNGLLGGSGLAGIEHFSNFGLMVLAPAAALQLTENLVVGLSPQLGYGTLRMKMPLAQPDLNRFGVADLEGDALTCRWKLGVLWQPGERFGVGLAYTSAADLDLRGDASIATAASDLPGFPPQSLLRGDLEMDIGWPDAYKAGVFFDFRRQGGPLVALEVQRVRWSRYFESIPVRFRNLRLNGNPVPDQSFAMAIGMDDQTAYRVGIELPLGNRWDVRAGYIYGQNPVPESGILPVFNPIVEHHLTAGLGYRSSAGFAANAAAVWGLKNTVRGSADHAVSPDAVDAEVDMGFFSVLLQFSYIW
jgi:long-chain fatty acid transport protein